MITETVLEMHFHKPLMDLFRSTFGLGNTGTINFYKYSPQRECFIGFDQAYIKTELSEDDLFTLLRDSATSKNYRLNERFLGYFLQFKVVQEMKIKNRYTPSSIVNRPYYRVTLDTKKNINTGLSQHELLYNLNQNQGAMVYYACPMIFDRSALYEINVDLDLLRLPGFSSCPSAYTDNDNHFIYFNGTQDVPVWRSDPVAGKALSPHELANALSTRIKQFDPPQLATELLKLLTDIGSVGLSPQTEVLRDKSTPNILPFVAESLTLLRISRLDDE